jgi:hypothetical protein
MLANWGILLEAAISHQLTIDGSDIEISVVVPENFVEEEVAELDLVFQDPENPGHQLLFHYFPSSDFDLTSFNDVYDYIDWLVEQISPISQRSKNSFYNGKNYSRCSFMTTDANGLPVYCFVYIGQIEGELIFSNMATSLTSFDDATERSAHFLNNVFWKRLK